MVLSNYGVIKFIIPLCKLIDSFTFDQCIHLCNLHSMKNERSRIYFYDQCDNENQRQSDIKILLTLFVDSSSALVCIAVKW